MDLTYSLDTLLILCAAIMCLSLGFKHTRCSLHSTVGRSVKAQDDDLWRDVVDVVPLRLLSALGCSTAQVQWVGNTWLPGCTPNVTISHKIVQINVVFIVNFFDFHALHLNVKIETYQHIHITCWWWGWKNHGMQEAANVGWFEREERHLYTRPVAVQQTNSGIFRCYFEFLVTLRLYATGEVEYRSSRRRLIKIAERGTPPQHTLMTHVYSVEGMLLHFL